ncbi:unnamed protein product, partial [Fusarium graminearum]
MCIANYIHYHHMPPCTRPIIYSYHYTFCAAAHYDPITSHPLEPCDSVSTSSPYGDLNDPCSMSQCMVDRRCSSGECRLKDLNGRQFERQVPECSICGYHDCMHTSSSTAHVSILGSFASHSMTINVRKEAGYIQEMKNKIQSQYEEPTERFHSDGRFSDLKGLSLFLWPVYRQPIMVEAIVVSYATKPKPMRPINSDLQACPPDLRLLWEIWKPCPPSGSIAVGVALVVQGCADEIKER